ncbi:hypothetical protein [Bradyrhizobium sp.]
MSSRASITILEARFYRPAVPVRDLAKLPAYYSSGYGANKAVVRTPKELARRLCIDSLRVQDHQIFSYLMQRAGAAAGSPGVHRIPTHDALAYLGRSHSDLVASLARLGNARIQIDGCDDAGKQSIFICSMLSANLRNGSLEYAFDSLLLKYMDKPAVFSLLHLDELRRFRTMAGYRLFEYLSISFGLEAALVIPHRLTQTELHYIFGDFKQCSTKRAVEKGRQIEIFQPAEWDRFNRATLQRAVEEFNQISTMFNVHAEVRHGGRGNRVIEVVFSLRRKRRNDEIYGNHRAADLYADGWIPTQPMLWVEARREERGLTPQRTRRRTKRSEEFDIGNLRAWTRTDISLDIQDRVRDLIRHEMTDCIDPATGARAHPDQIIRTWQPEFSAIQLKRWQRVKQREAQHLRHGKPFVYTPVSIDDEWIDFVGIKLLHWKDHQKSARHRLIREIFNPAAKSHLDHVDDEPAPPLLVDAVDAHVGIRAHNVDWSAADPEA